MVDPKHPPVRSRVLPSNGGLMNKDFRYVRSAESKIEKTFARFTRQQKAEAEAKASNVKPLRKAKP